MQKKVKVGRGLGIEIREQIEQSKELKELINQKDYFLGIRNNYFNIYYRGASMGKFSLCNQELIVEVDPKYLSNGTKDKREKLKSFLSQVNDIRNNIDQHRKDKSNIEKECQQIIVNESYNNIKDGALCIDMEYVREFGVGRKEDINSRFDMIMVSTEPNKVNQYEVTLIELKVGTKALKDDSPKKYGYKINLDDTSQDLKSGLLGHIGKYYRYLKDETGYEQLKGEIVHIIENYKTLGVLPEYVYKGITVADFMSQPKVVFLIYSGDSTLQQIKDSTANYLFEGRGRSSQYNVQKCLETGKGIPIDIRKPIDINEKSYLFNFYFREGVAIKQQCSLVLDDPYLFE